ncbi:MAG: hypothetical protein GY851_31160, partial [bacterium]|nr:hypothetical protein [bacterium]
MRRLRYNDASQSLRFEFPDNWLTASACTITITDTGGTETLAADAATVYTATTTDGAIAAGDSTFTVDGAAAMEAGDRFRISKSRDTTEIVTVLSQAAKVSTIRHTFDYAHSDESVVAAMFCTYALDTSTVADFDEGEAFTITWTPNTDDIPYTEDAIVYALTGAEVAGWREHFRARYPNLYTEAQGRLGDL